MHTLEPDKTDPVLADFLFRSVGQVSRLRRRREEEVLRLLRHLSTFTRGNAPVVPGLNACLTDTLVPRKTPGLRTSEASTRVVTSRTLWAFAWFGLVVVNLVIINHDAILDWIIRQLDPDIGVRYGFAARRSQFGWNFPLIELGTVVLAFNVIAVGVMLLIWLRGRGNRALAHHHKETLPATHVPSVADQQRNRRWLRIVGTTLVLTLYGFGILLCVALDNAQLAILLGALGAVPMVVVFTPRVSPSVLFLKSRMTLLRRGVAVPTGTALNLLALRERLLRGQQLSEAMAGLSRVFPAHMAGSVRAAEASGCVAQCLQALGDAHSQQSKFEQAHVARRAYVALIFLIGSLITTFLLLKVVPVMEEISREFGSKLPASTRAVIAVGDFIVYRWPDVLVLAAVLVILWLLLCRRIRLTRVLISQLALCVPVSGKALRLRQAAHATRMLHDLTRAQVPLPMALGTLSDAGLCPAFSQTFARWQARAEAGASLSECAEGDRTMPQGFAALARLGEVGDALPEAMAHAAELYDALARRAEQSVQTVAFPIYLAPVAGMVYFITSAFYEMLSGISDAVFYSL